MTEKELMLTSILDCERIDLYVDPLRLSSDQEQEFLKMQERRRVHEPLQYIIGECEFCGLKFKVDRRVLIPRPETEILVEKIFEIATREASLSSMKREASFVKREAQEGLFLGTVEKWPDARHRRVSAETSFLDVAQASEEITPQMGVLQQSSLRILDLGTGSGNIAVTLAKFLTESEIVTVDISRDALDLAGENAGRHDVMDRIRFVHADMVEFFESHDNSGGLFDIIVANPPYIKSRDIGSLPPDVQKEPRLALDGGEDGLRLYRAIISSADKFLREGGHLIGEIGDGQRDSIAALLEQSFFSSVDFILDYMRTPRIFIAKK